MTNAGQALPRQANGRGLKRVDAVERRRRILLAASTLFLKKGYEDTSLNDIIRICGGSKASIVEHFANKAGLFAAFIETSALTFSGGLKAILVTSPRATLQAYGEAILRFYLKPEALLAYRGVIAAGPKHPDIARAFYQRGHEHIVTPIAEQLRRWHALGKIADVDFHSEADRFTHMLRNGIYEQHLLGFVRKATPREIEQQVRGAVRVLLQGLET